MLTHQRFGPGFGLSSGSPFCTKVDFLLSMAGIEVKTDISPEVFHSAPKRRLPVFKHGDRLIPDSEHMKEYLEDEHGADFTGGYGPKDLATANAFVRLAEHSLYYILVCHRWLDEENFKTIIETFFSGAPEAVALETREKVKTKLALQGYGDHTPQQRLALAQKDLSSISITLGDNPYFLGNAISFVDASLAALLLHGLALLPNSALADQIQKFPNLEPYAHRVAEELGTAYAKAA